MNRIIHDDSTGREYLEEVDLICLFNRLDLLPDLSPCNSPIEDSFYYEFQKHAHPDLHLIKQFEAPVGRYNFRLDFVGSFGDRSIAIECDGKKFHDAERDNWRDQQILKAGFADIIYRLRGRDIHGHIHDALDLLRSREPFLFSDRGHANIAVLATRENERRDKTLVTKWGMPYALVRSYETIDEYDEEAERRGVWPTVVSWRE